MTSAQPTSEPAAQAAPPLRVVVLAGQSNMVGYRTSIEDLAPRWRKPQPGCLFWKNGAWRPLIPGKLAQRTAFGPELSLAHWMTTAEDGPVGIVKVAVTASYLGRHWSPDIENGLFQQLVAKTRAALADRPARLSGLGWLQGEADSIEEGEANQYRERFEAFVERFRIAIGAPTLPVAAAIVNPPADQCPYRDTVRTALRTAEIDHYHTIRMDDLAMQRDNLHLRHTALSKIGKRFARTLHAETGPRLVTRWIWQSPNYQCWYTGPDPMPKTVLVSFPFAVSDSGFDEHAFGQRAFEKRGIGTIYIRSHRSNWFQHAEVMEMADAIRAATGDEAVLTLYGASMGAYAALLLSGRLKAARVIAVAPQYSIDRADVPWETRWSRAAKRIGSFLYRLEDTVSPSARKYVFYDRLSLDRQQVDLLPVDDTWSVINFPFASHQVLRFLKEKGSLSPMLSFLADPETGLSEIQTTARQNRRASTIYWMTLAGQCADRRPDLALWAYERALECGGKPNRIRKLVRQIEDARKATA